MPPNLRRIAIIGLVLVLVFAAGYVIGGWVFALLAG